MTYNIDPNKKLSSSNEDELFIRTGIANFDPPRDSDGSEGMDPKEYALELIKEWQDALVSDTSDASNTLSSREIDQISLTPPENFNDFEDASSLDSLANSNQSINSSPETNPNQPENPELGWKLFLEFEKEKNFYSFPPGSFSASSLEMENSGTLDSSSFNSASAPQPSIPSDLQLSWSTYHQKKKKPLPPKVPTRYTPPQQESPEESFKKSRERYEKANRFLSKNKTRILTGFFIGATVPAVAFGAPVTGPLIAGSLCAGLALGASETRGYLKEKIEEAPSDANEIKILMGSMEVDIDQARNVSKVAKKVELGASIAGTVAAAAGGFINPSDVPSTFSNVASGVATAKDTLQTLYKIRSNAISNSNDSPE